MNLQKKKKIKLAFHPPPQIFYLIARAYYSQKTFLNVFNNFQLNFFYFSLVISKKKKKVERLESDQCIV